jgi:DNA-binding GntR family transcriptional regulator
LDATPRGEIGHTADGGRRDEMTIPRNGALDEPLDIDPIVAGNPSSTPLVDDLATRIHAAILAGEIPLGTWLRQEQLADQFGVSRTPVREALRILQASGVVRQMPNRGALVEGPTPTEIREAYVVRAELEGLAAYLAAENADARDQELLAAAHARFVEAIDVRLRRPLARDPAIDDPWIRANDGFHDAVMACARNRRLQRTVLELRGAFPTQSDLGALLEEPSLIADNASQHARVLNAIQRRDPAAARTWMIDHVRRSGEITAQWFERDRPAPE